MPRLVKLRPQYWDQSVVPEGFGLGSMCVITLTTKPPGSRTKNRLTFQDSSVSG